VAQPGQLTLDTTMPPSQVLPGHRNTNRATDQPTMHRNNVSGLTPNT
jgi:hypothetical protein